MAKKIVPRRNGRSPVGTVARKVTPKVRTLPLGKKVFPK